VITADDIVAAARGMLGTPFRHQGRQPGLGLDCDGLLFCAGWACGVDLPDFVDYGPEPDAAIALAAIRARAIEVANDLAGPGCIVAMPILARSRPQHFGLLTDGDRWIHCASDIGRVVETDFPTKLRRRVLHVFRYPGVTY